MKHILDALSSVFPMKLTIGSDKEPLAARVASSSSAVYVNNDVAILLGFALLLAAIALIVLLIRQSS